MRRVLVLNGPNLDLLGVREPAIYGETTLPELEGHLRAWGIQLELEVEAYQSNVEGELIEHIHAARTRFDGLVINAGALTHYSRALQDALTAVDLPTVEVHISNVMEREPFRRKSVLTPPAIHTIYGRGLEGYRWALRHLVHRAAMPVDKVAYGPFRDQFGDLRGRSGGRLAILFHGGQWRPEWTRDTLDGLAVDLERRGYVTWNLEYRRVGGGGGWPESFDDAARALRAARDLTGIPPDRTAVVGHGSGATMALWVGAADVAPALVVALGPLPDLVRAEVESLGGVPGLIGRERPTPPEYSPFHRLPVRTPTIVAWADDDDLVPRSHQVDFEARARAVGDSVRVVRVPGNNDVFLEPGAAAWGQISAILESEFPAEG